jgi:hypothetical protein
MIRYPITPAQLRARIRAHNANWLDHAAERTDGFEAAGRFTEKSGESIWGAVKEVYMELQNNKCAYCERKLAGRDVGKIEFDVEHYRPKNGVKAWPTRRLAKERGLAYDFVTGDAHPGGYFLLAYEPRNYAVACKPCNSALKSNYFPIGAARAEASRSIAKYKSEKPLLPYPIGSGDVDPESLLLFDGILPTPAEVTGFPNQRARVTIEFFRLADREDLMRERAEVISHVWNTTIALHAARGAKAKLQAQQTLEMLQSPKHRHSSCARTFVRLLSEDHSRASALYEEIHAFLQSES